ncbi:MAG: ABC transporter ATP-binding protein [Kiritimatiellae bacterium]|nr:ABC transporter ATP-binding protein [Kiritimatiellia bacterium]MDD5519980.1 ABC transporter ATP-binding protein [Kiritimatiellia bacterium]
MALLEIKNLKVFFEARNQSGKTSELRAVDGVSFELEKGEILGLVGESGCGKTTIGNAIVGMVPVTEGSIRFEGQEITALRGKSVKLFRQKVQMIFQDPFGSLNPRMSIGAGISEVLKVHKLVSGKNERSARVAELLKAVGLEAEYAARYPHEFSGGQRQRLGIARALALKPSLILADEPVSALDVSVQVQILNLLKDLQKEMDLSYLFIAHDLAVVRYMCDRILVMYLGKIVESAAATELFGKPAHPYTEALLSAVPDVDKGLKSRTQGSKRIVLKGDVPSATERIPGCPFHPRCHRVQAICSKEVPPVKDCSKGHFSVCHFAGKF